MAPQYHGWGAITLIPVSGKANRESIPLSGTNSLRTQRSKPRPELCRLIAASLPTHLLWLREGKSLDGLLYWC